MFGISVATQRVSAMKWARRNQQPKIPPKSHNKTALLHHIITAYGLTYLLLGQAEKSAIAKNVFDEEEVVQMLVEFSEAAGRLRYLPVHML